MDTKKIDILVEALEKAGGFKYIKRIPHPNPSKGRKWIYFYNQKQIKDFKEKGVIPGEEKKSGGILAGIMEFFGIKSEDQAKERVKETYEKHKNDLGDVSLDKFSSHLNEYLSNKDKWDARLNKAPKEKKEGGAKIEKPKSESEKREMTSGQKWDTSLMKKIAEIYGGGEKKEESVKSELMSDVEKKKLEDKLKELKSLSDKFNGIIKGKKDYHPEEAKGDVRFITIGDRGYALRDFSEKEQDELYDIKNKIIKGFKNEKFDNVGFDWYNPKTNEAHFTTKTKSEKESTKISEHPDDNKSPLAESADKLDEAVKGGTNDKIFASSAEFLAIKNNEIKKKLKAANDEQEQIKKENPGWKKDEKLAIKIARLDKQIEDLTEESGKFNRGAWRDEYRKILEKKGSPGPSDINEFPEESAALLSKQSGIDFYHDEELGNKIRAKYRDSNIQVDGLRGKGFVFRVNGNVIKEEKGYEDRQFKDVKEFQKYLDKTIDDEEKERSDYEGQIKSQGWEKSKLDKTQLRVNMQSPSNPRMEPLDPKSIKGTFKVWGEDLFVHKSAQGGWAVSEKKTGLRIGKGSNQKEAIDSTKNLLAIQGKDRFKSAIETNAVKEDKKEEGSRRNPDTLSDDQIHADVLEAAKMPQKQLEKNADIVNQQIKMAEKQGKKDAIKRLEYMGATYRVAQLHKDKKMSKDEIVGLVDNGADLNRKPMKKASSQGPKIEKEHSGTYKFIEDYFKKNGKMPPALDVYKSIAGEHENEIRDYYIRLVEMEKQADNDKKRPKIEMDVIKFLIHNPNPKDDQVHKFAEKMKINPYELESVFYKLATDRAKMSVGLRKAIFSLTETLLQKGKEMPVGTVSKGRRKVAKGKWVPVGEKKEGKEKKKPEEKDKKKTEKKETHSKLSDDSINTIKTTLKKVANILASALSGRDSVQPAGAGVEEVGENVRTMGRKGSVSTKEEKTSGDTDKNKDSGGKGKK